MKPHFFKNPEQDPTKKHARTLSFALMTVLASTTFVAVNAVSATPLSAALLQTGQAAQTVESSAENTPEAPLSEVSNLDDPMVTEAVEFTRDLTDRANDAFTNTQDANEQLVNFQHVLNEGLALDFLGRFMLGEYRNDLTEAQQERYNKIFPIYITRLYADQFKDIAGKELTINDATPFGRRDVIVRTQFLRDDGSPVKVDWRARKLKTEGHKMIDIIVSGVSIMTVKREEFSGFIATNGIDALIIRLETEAEA